MSSDVLRLLADRGFIYQCTDLVGLGDLLGKGPTTAYIGFDATASSLHVGHLVQLMMLRWLRKSGHRPLVLLGSATTQVGDPSGRSTQRPMLSPEEIANNKQGLQQTCRRILGLGNPSSRTEATSPTTSAEASQATEGEVLFCDNAEWFDSKGMLEFLREVGGHFTVNRLVSLDTFCDRLERQLPLSYLEFSYVLLQAYDFVEVARRYGCRLQMGGADQWGNITSGIDLGRRLAGFELYGLTTPLLTTADGRKMGKTAQGAVWLDGESLSPYDYWQFWRNTHDSDVGRFLRLFTELPLDEISRLESLPGEEINEAKKILATEACALCHGKEAAKKAVAKADWFFKSDVPRLSIGRDECPTISCDHVENGDTWSRALFLLSAKQEGWSRGHVKRMLAGGAVRIIRWEEGTEGWYASMKPRIVKLQDVPVAQTLAEGFDIPDIRQWLTDRRRKGILFLLEIAKKRHLYFSIDLNLGPMIPISDRANDDHQKSVAPEINDRV